MLPPSHYFAVRGDRLNTVSEDSFFRFLGRPSKKEGGESNAFADWFRDYDFPVVPEADSRYKKKIFSENLRGKIPSNQKSFPR